MNVLNWFKDKTKQLYSKVLPAKSLVGNSSMENKYVFGSLYFFHYDPKWKDSLPYYDTFPMVFPIQPAKGGFLGLNLHYLPPRMRMDFIEKMMTFEKYSMELKVKLRWQTIKQTSMHKLAEPCVKHYLTDHIRSRFLYVHPSEWQYAASLSLERFVGASKQDVWKDSKGMLKK